MLLFLGGESVSLFYPQCARLTIVGCVHLDWIPFRLIDNLRPSKPSSIIHFSLRKPKTCFSFSFGSTSRLLSAERAALGQAGLTTGGLAKDLGAAGADNDGLGVREDGGDGEATGALDVHEEGARAGDKHLQLVLTGLGLRGGVEEIDCENHLDGV